MSAIWSSWYFWFICWVTPCMLIWKGIEVCSIGVPSGRVMACTRRDPGHPEDRLGDFVDDQEVRGITQIVIAFNHQHFGVHPRLREVPIRCRVARIRGAIGGQVVAVIVVGPIPGQGQQAHQCHRRSS